MSETVAVTPVLTVRESEIMNLLLSGVIPKEIANTLNISYATVLGHQKNLYRKLDVHNINELLVRFSNINGTVQTERQEPATKAVFVRWDTFEDDFGSYVNYTPKIELIQDNYTETYVISGNTSYKSHAYAGILAHPDISMLEMMRKAKRFSFSVMGDGNIYEVKIPTTEAMENADYNFYGKRFSTENGVISDFNFYIDELAPLFLFGKEVPFVRDSIYGFLIQVCSKGDFNLKFWDIRFH